MNRLARQTNPVGAVIGTPAEEPPATPWYHTWKLITAVCVTVLLLVCGAIAVAVYANRTHQTPAEASSEKAAVANWWAGARDDFSTLQNATDQVNRGLTQGDGSEMTGGCQIMHDTAAVSLEAKMPTPDPELTAEVKGMIADFHEASHMCLSVMAGSMNSYAGEFRSYLEQAVLQMHAAQDRVSALTQT